ncbi:hypothetical protein DFH06DRAFT_1344943 [Mycena polygramma]|nr:hypothetical protein DFH06DRAFT_1344943 [Mycena polygramma]
MAPLRCFISGGSPVSTRDLLISAVHRYASANSSNINATFPSVYNTQSGPAQPLSSPNGATFALVAPPAPGLESKSVRNSTDAIIGGTIGALAVLTLIGAVLFLRRKRRRRQARDQLRVAQPYDGGPNTGTASDSPAVAPAISNPSRAEKGAPNLSRRKTDPLLPEALQSGSSQHHTSELRGRDDLRSELQRLREAVEQLRTTQVPEEAPPGYQ